MRELYKRSGVKFIVGAPLASSSPEVAEGMLKKSLELGPAVLGVEMGNEPAYWSCTGQVSGLLSLGKVVLTNPTGSR